jgi:YYY domain-containing protein
MIGAAAQAGGLIFWLLILKILQTALWPVLSGAFGRFSYPVSYPLSFLLFGGLSWYLGLAHIPVQAAVVPFLVIIGYYAITGWYTREKFSGVWKWDLAFLLCFIFMTEIRFFNPMISYAEKFMDHTFLASVMRAPVVPPADPWFAGGTLAIYYYLGHWMMGVTGLLSGVPSSVAFNLILPTVFANAAVTLYAAGHLLLKRFRALPVLALFLVNPSCILQIFLGASAHDILWNSTRTIPDTINEYPFFSFLWGDPHAHVISLFVQALFIFLMLYILHEWGGLSERNRWICLGGVALCLGVMPGMNSWDVLVYAPLLLVVGAIIWYRARRAAVPDPYPWRLFLVCPVVSVLFFAPYYLMLTTQGIAGIGMVTNPSAVTEFMLVYGFFIVIFWCATLRDIRENTRLLIVLVPFLLTGYWAAGLAAVPLAALILRRTFRPAEVIAILGLGVLIFTELFYLIDGMGDDFYRMNTVFKFGLTAWMMMSVGAFIWLGEWLTAHVRVRFTSPWVLRAGAGAIALLLICAPVVIPDLTYGYGGKTLDGLAWVKASHPGDAAAVAYLSALPGNITIVEAEGGDYHYYSRISSFTGIPTVIGMPFHEIMWRGADAGVSQRMADVRIIYEDPFRSPSLLTLYGVDYLVVGDTERERYTVCLPDGFLEQVFSENGTSIFRVLAHSP